MTLRLLQLLFLQSPKSKGLLLADVRLPATSNGLYIYIYRWLWYGYICHWFSTAHICPLQLGNNNANPEIYYCPTAPNLPAACPLMLCPCPSGESCPGHGMRKVQATAATAFKQKCTNMWRSFKSCTRFSGLQGSSEVPKPSVEPLAERPKAAPPEPTESEASPAARTAPEAWKRWRVQKMRAFCGDCSCTVPVYANPSLVLFGLISISLKEERTPDGLARVSQWPLLLCIYSMFEYVVLPFMTEDSLRMLNMFILIPNIWRQW